MCIDAHLGEPNLFLLFADVVLMDSTAVSKTAGLCSNHNGRVKSDHLHFSKLTYQKLLEKCNCVVAEYVDA